MNIAKFVQEINVIDPDTKGKVSMSVFKHEQSNGMFAIDSSYLDQCFDDDKNIIIYDPLDFGEKLLLTGV